MKKIKLFKKQDKNTVSERSEYFPGICVACGHGELLEGTMICNVCKKQLPPDDDDYFLTIHRGKRYV